MISSSSRTNPIGNNPNNLNNSNNHKVLTGSKGRKPKPVKTLLNDINCLNLLVTIMIKLIFLLAALPLLLASCHDDKDLPKVNISIDYSNAVQLDGTIYVVQGDTLVIDAVNVTPEREGAKVGLGSVTYFLDGWMIGVNPVSPFGANIVTTDLATGNHILALEMPVLEVGCELATGYITVPLTIVATADDIPSGTTQAAIPLTPSIHED